MKIMKRIIFRFHLILAVILLVVMIFITVESNAADFPRAKRVRNASGAVNLKSTDPVVTEPAAANPDTAGSLLKDFQQEVKNSDPELAAFLHWLEIPGASIAEIKQQTAPVRLDPNLTRVLIGCKYLVEGYPEEALRRARSVPRRTYGYDAALLLNAISLLRVNQNKEAREVAESALTLARGDPTGHYLAALASASLDDQKSLRRHGRRADTLYHRELQPLLASLPPVESGKTPTVRIQKVDHFAAANHPRLSDFKDTGQVLAIGLSTSGGRSISRPEARFRLSMEGRLEPGGRQLVANQVYNLRINKKKQWSLNGVSLGNGDSIRVKVSGGGIFVDGIEFGHGFNWAGKENRCYRGEIEFRMMGKGMILINHLPLEMYLAGVLPAEMPASSPVEALKAQAVAARSETLAKWQSTRHKSHGYDLCDDVHCQAYRGGGWESSRSNQAVLETAAQMMVNDTGRPLDAVYGACCGGHTQSSSDLKGWGKFAHLQGCRDGGTGGGLAFLTTGEQDHCAHASLQHRWCRLVKKDSWLEVLGKKSGMNKITTVSPLQRNPSGHLRSVRFSDGKSSKTVEKELVLRRTILPGVMLRSSALLPILIHGKLESWVLLAGGGFGHGVGLCQEGAIGMAKAGVGYREILRFYYQNPRLEKNDGR